MRTICDYLDKTVAGREEKIAVSCKEAGVVKHITFSQLKQDIYAVAKSIRDMGYHWEKFILIGENSYRWMVYALGIIVSDNILVPVDNRMDKKGYQEMVQRVEAKGVCYSKAVEATVNDSDIYKVNINESVLKPCEDVLSLDSNIDDIALIMFTSGSTGASKGVCLSQRNLIVSAISSVEHALVDADSFKNIICLPMYHIFCFAVDFLWLIIKGCPIAINSSVIALKDEIKEFEASRVCMVPMMAETILTGLHMTKNQNKDLDVDEVRELTLGKKFKRIILGGAFIEPALREGLVSYGIEVICGYGMTEATGPVSSEEGAGERAGSIGDILPCNEVKIIDNEICVKGENVMLGYYNDPETTQETLQDGWLKTGDFGYIKDNYLYITGKKKNLIITANGENVSPEELETYIHESPIVKEVVCFQKNNQIRALIYPNLENIEQITMDTIKEKLSVFIQGLNRKLPFYKHIQYFELTDKELEKTPSMKIKREKYYYKGCNGNE